jgi:hypothetical protein
MFRWLAVAALGAGLLVTPAWAQRRGGGGGGGFGGHAGFASHGGFAGGGMSASRGFGSSGSFRGPHFGGGFSRPGFSRGPRFVTRWPYYGYGGYYGYPYYGYPYSGDDSYYPSDNYADNGGYASDPGEQQQQQAEINRLEDEVERLRQQRSSTASQTPSKNDMHSLTELVFQDKHTEEVQNYAIVGQTFWVFDGKMQRIPLSALDVSATVKANEARGVDFQLPQ